MIDALRLQYQGSEDTIEDSKVEESDPGTARVANQAHFLLLVATLFSLMGYTWIDNYVFVALPLATGIALAVLVGRTPPETDAPREERVGYWRRSLIQIGTCCVTCSVFLVISLAYGWGTRRSVGYGIILGSLLLLGVLTLLAWKRRKVGRASGR